MVSHACPCPRPTQAPTAAWVAVERFGGRWGPVRTPQPCGPGSSVPGCPSWDPLAQPEPPSPRAELPAAPRLQTAPPQSSHRDRSETAARQRPDCICGRRKLRWQRRLWAQTHLNTGHGHPAQLQTQQQACGADQLHHRDRRRNARPGGTRNEHRALAVQFWQKLGVGAHLRLRPDLRRSPWGAGGTSSSRTQRRAGQWERHGSMGPHLGPREASQAD